MSRVTLGASLLVAIASLSLSGKAIAQTADGEPEVSATGGGYGGEGGAAGEAGQPGEAGGGGYGGGRGYGGRGGEGGRGGYGGEYGGRYGSAGSEPDDLFGPASARDDRENPAATNVNKASRDSRPGTSAAEHIESALSEPLKGPLQYEDQPLIEIIDTLQEEYNIPIMFDIAALEEVAISADTEVTINLRNISLRSALNLMLRQPGLEDLTFVIDDEVLLITTEEKANEKMTVEVYRVDDLTRGVRQLRSSNEHPYSSLVQVISQCVAFDTWKNNGSGEGEVLLMEPGLLVVANTRRVHEQVQQLLEKLRSVRAEVDEDRTNGRGGYGGGRGYSAGNG